MKNKELETKSIIPKNYIITSIKKDKSGWYFIRAKEKNSDRKALFFWDGVAKCFNRAEFYN